MDSAKISEAFETLRGFFSSRNSGAHWTKRSAKTAAQPQVFGPSGYSVGASTWEILETAEATRLFALGLDRQPRLGLRHAFTCSANLADQRFSEQCLGGMAIENAVVLNQTLECAWRPLVWTKTLLEVNQHAGRRIRLAYKIEDGPNCQICRQIRRKYTIVQNLASVIWLDRIPESNETGYLIAQFD